MYIWSMYIFQFQTYCCSFMPILRYAYDWFIALTFPPIFSTQSFTTVFWQCGNVHERLKDVKLIYSRRKIQERKYEFCIIFMNQSISLFRSRSCCSEDGILIWSSVRKVARVDFWIMPITVHKRTLKTIFELIY